MSGDINSADMCKTDQNRLAPILGNVVKQIACYTFGFRILTWDTQKLQLQPWSFVPYFSLPFFKSTPTEKAGFNSRPY